MTKIISPYKNRIDFLINIKDLDIKRSCEVGVLRAHYSCEILKNIPSLQTHYAIDAWTPQKNYNDLANKSAPQHNADYNCAVSNLRPFIKQGKVEILRGDSIDMAKEIKDDSLDFIYIDARHDYMGVMADFHAYWPKLKSGGIFSGHDYMEACEVKGQDWSLCADGTHNPKSVKGAVEDWAQRYGLQILLSYKEPAWHTWCMLKD